MNRFVFFVFFVFFFITEIFLAAVAYGEVTVTGEAGFSNIGGANDGKENPFLKYSADASTYTLLGTSRIGVALELQFVVDLQEASSNGNNLGDNFISVYYARTIGPGLCMFALNQSTALSYWNIEPSFEYSGIKTGFATMDFGLWYNHKFTRKIAVTAETTAPNTNSARNASLSLRHPHPDGHDDEGGGTTSGGGSSDGGGASTPAFYGGGGPYSDKFGFKISAAFDFGLKIHYGLNCGFNKSGSGGAGDGAGLKITKILYLDLNYHFSDLIQAGLELDDTGKDFSRFTLNLYGAFNIFGDTVMGFNVYFRNINSAAGNLEIGPSVWVMYTF